MTTTTKALGVVAAAAVIAAGIAGVRILNRSTAGPPAPADICTGNYYYIDACGDWRVNWPGQGPNTDQGACAHARTAQDPSNGVRYYIVGQGAGGTRYPKPPASAIFALAEWSKCFVDHDTSGNFPSCLLPPVGGTQSPIMRTLSWPGIPKDKHDSWVAQFHCNVPTVVPPPTLTPTGFCTPRVVTVVVTATPKPAVTPAPVKTKPPVTPGTPGPKPTPQHTPPPEKTKVVHHSHRLSLEITEACISQSSAAEVASGACLLWHNHPNSERPHRHPMDMIERAWFDSRPCSQFHMPCHAGTLNPGESISVGVGPDGGHVLPTSNPYMTSTGGIVARRPE